MDLKNLNIDSIKSTVGQMVTGTLADKLPDNISTDNMDELQDMFKKFLGSDEGKEFTNKASDEVKSSINIAVQEKDVKKVWEKISEFLSDSKNLNLISTTLLPFLMNNSKSIPSWILNIFK